MCAKAGGERLKEMLLRYYSSAPLYLRFNGSSRKAERNHFASGKAIALFSLFAPGVVCRISRGGEHSKKDETAILHSKQNRSAGGFRHVFIGAESISSPFWEELDILLKQNKYNHYSLTVSFPRPQTLTEAKMIVQGHYFLGLFPLPEYRVRTVLLIKPEEYKAR